MQAVLLQHFNGPLTLSEVPEPECPDDGVIIDIAACGVCRSDHHAWKGADPDVQLPHIMGHEFAGVVTELGPACQQFQIGDRVTAPFILGCGQCPDCHAGEPTICNAQSVIGFNRWGAFAERIAIGHADFNLVHLPDNIDFATAAGMGCRVTTAFRSLTDRAGLHADEWLVVHGCGGVGLSAIMIAKALGARIIAVDVNPAALALAQNFGAEHIINAAQTEHVGEAVRELSGGGAHVALDALGLSSTFHNALHSLRKLGRHVQIGMPLGSHAQVNLPLLDMIYARQLSIHGSRGMGAAGFPALLDLISQGHLDLAPLVTRHIKLSEVGESLQRMDSYQGSGVTVITTMNA